VRRTLDGEPFDRRLARELGLSVPELQRDLVAWVDRLP